ncbi:LptF/LptG family permease [Entomospira culicis]|uniref:LptF/LptG family permease n=1 Tax=Entomospira culicis TaxID=2719989 RepID=A0A968GIB2_9SPIO|nr:LptF/LptG family permease [Entomospira culicis]NIZ18950.1 LptF/LptG family permease [Entomospira culicis]NIZ69165.1 LptF/LptG family permease [Entomospira culicis]WDI37752.1 LptF/LptG family permease [Entomospira culicis]WDI39380.1 LptF/LptG family permease [Entomospira culicis]
MDRVRKHLIKNWLVTWGGTTLILFLLLYLVFFALLFLQVMDKDDLALGRLFVWVMLRSGLIFHGLLPIIFLLSIVILVFTLEQKSELKVIYLCGKSLHQGLGFIWLFALLLILFQLATAWSILPSMERKNEWFEVDILGEASVKSKKAILLTDKYLIEIEGINKNTREVRGLQVIALSPKRPEGWRWLEAMRAVENAGEWHLERVRGVTTEEDWYTAEVLTLSEWMPTWQEVERRFRGEDWAKSSSSTLYVRLGEEHLLGREQNQLKHFFASRMGEWWILLLLLVPIFWYDPSKKFALLRLFGGFFGGFLLVQLADLWVNVWLQYTSVSWVTAMVIPFLLLAGFLFLLWVLGERKKR